MDTENNLCRVCLEEGASCPIFETLSQQNSIYSKLALCMKEKIEDISGFPRNMCGLCIDTLETVCNFINKYKESSKILQSGLLVVKEENIHLKSFSDNEHSYASEVEIEIDNIKVEPSDYDDFDDNACLAELIKPVHQKKVIKRANKEIDKIKLNKEITIKKVKSEFKNKTNKVASSLLEGEFTWTGDKWCLKTCKVSDKPSNKQIQNSKTQEKRSREIKLKIPKIKKPNPPKLCDVCGEVFKTQEKLSNHKRNMHYKNPVKCPDCTRTYASIDHLRRHAKRRHEKSKSYICSTCGHGFAFKGELTSHNNKVHNKHLRPPKVFPCKFCDKTYKCAKSVTVHVRSVHTGQRPAECSVCGSSFFHEDYLKEHMRLHTGETPFKCPICDRGYAQRGNMKSHLRIHRLAEIDAATLSKLKPNYLKLLKDFR